MGGRPTSLAANSNPVNFATPTKSSSSTSTSSSSSVDSVFGSVPTQLEAEYAITAFQSFMMQGLSSSMSSLDRIQPILSHEQLQSTGFRRVYDAFHLLQTVPYVLRMVVSISSDKAVWNAVMSNNEVQEFRLAINQAKSSRSQRSDEEPALVSIILKWVLDNMKLKVLQLIESLKSVVSKNVESSQNENTTNSELKHGFEEMIVSTVLLSTITLMIVLVTRAYGA